MTKLVELQQISNVFTELLTAFDEIPFDNSDYQNYNFVIAAQHTPARMYRAIGLRMFNRINALQELKYNRALEEVQIKRHRATIEDPNSDELQREIAQIKIDKILSSRPWMDKLIKDSLHELNYLYTQFKKFPKYNRISFEAEEEQHFQVRLHNQLECQGNGSLESLTHIETANQLDEMLAIATEATLNELTS